jgi:hypothetical protein
VNRLRAKPKNNRRSFDSAEVRSAQDDKQFIWRLPQDDMQMMRRSILDEPQGEVH